MSADGNSAPIIQSSRVSPTMSKNLVEEEFILYVVNAGELSAGETDEAYLAYGSPGDVYEVNQGECIELISLGVVTGGPLHVTVRDSDMTEWNTFFVSNPDSTPTANSLPFNVPVNFEERLLNWGYNSFDSKHVRNIVQGVKKGDRPRDDLKDANIAPTLKMPEGDELRIFVTKPASGGEVAVDGGVIKEDTIIVAKIRRYKNGYPVDCMNFNRYDGGLESYKQYYEDFGQATVGEDFESVCSKTLVKNEAFKFYSAGVWTPSSDDLYESMITIDDGRVEKDKYLTMGTINQLPFTDRLYSDSVMLKAKMHRFRPTIDIIQGNNEDITLSSRISPSGSLSNVVARFLGVRHELV